MVGVLRMPWQIKWLIENVPEVAQGVENQSCIFGTIDAWLIWVAS